MVTSANVDARTHRAGRRSLGAAERPETERPETGRPELGTPGEVLAGLAPISLDDLSAQAALLRRVDRKYLLSSEQTSALIDHLGASGARVLDIGGRREFSYLSDYFDTEDFRLFRLAATKRRRRWKVRTRVYLDTGLRFVELKTRNGREHNVKDRLRLDDVDVAMRRAYRSGAVTEFDDVLSDRRVTEWIATLLHSYGVYQALEDSEQAVAGLTGSLRSMYRRSTLHLPSDSRLTIDQGLVLCDPRETHRTRVPNMVVETKSGGRPSEADRWLWRHGLRPIRFSKYAVGLAQVHAELPANRWRRALNTLGGTT